MMQYDGLASPTDFRILQSLLLTFWGRSERTNYNRYYFYSMFYSFLRF